MKQPFIFLISLYQMVIPSLIRNLFGIPNTCRFSPTCSEYAKRSISSYGALKGIKYSIQRILSCQTIVNL